MVRLNRIYTRTGDDGSSGLSTGERRLKNDPRFEAIGSVDETNAAIGVARLHVDEYPDLDLMLGAIQNDLFDLGADLATPEADEPPAFEPLRILPVQVERLEKEIDYLNRSLAPLTTFVLPGGSAAAAHLHVARTVCRRAERVTVTLAQNGRRAGQSGGGSLSQPPVRLPVRGKPLGQRSRWSRRVVGTRPEPGVKRRTQAIFSAGGAPNQSPRHGGANLGKRERLGHDVVDQAVEAEGPFPLIGEAGHQQDGEVGIIPAQRPAPGRCRP